MRALPLLITLPLLTGCPGLNEVRVWDQSMQPATDDAYDFTLERFCAEPTDWHARAILRRGPTHAWALTLLCPEFRIFRDALTASPAVVPLVPLPPALLTPSPSP